MNPCRFHAAGAVVAGLACLLFLPPLSRAAGEEPLRHRFLAMDFWRGQVYYVDQFDPAEETGRCTGAAACATCSLWAARRRLAPPATASTCMTSSSG